MLPRPSFIVWFLCKAGYRLTVSDSGNSRAENGCGALHGSNEDITGAFSNGRSVDAKMNIRAASTSLFPAQMAISSGAFAVSGQQLNSPFDLAQGITAGAVTAQPEVFQGSAFCVLCLGVKAKEPSTIHAHQRLGALRIGTLRNHESVAKLHTVGRKLFVPCRLQSRAAEDGWQHLTHGAVNFCCQIRYFERRLSNHIFIEHKGTQRG